MEELKCYIAKGLNSTSIDPLNLACKFLKRATLPNHAHERDGDKNVGRSDRAKNGEDLQR